ncbi:LolA family protein [Myroides sp. C15-4]|uniref:LolA family protein n=1 Tax=Myroides sp. C15-4 TaxID=3400532 RepID=UPI003D2F9689
MKKIVLLLLTCTTVITYGQSSQRAKNYLDEVNKKIAGYTSISIDFHYSQIDGKSGDVNQETEGHIDLKENLYRLSFMDMTRIFDGKKIYTISEEDQEVTVSKYDPNKIDNALPLQFLAFYKTGFDLQWDIAQNIKGREIQYIKLIPTDKKSGIKEVLVGVDHATKQIYNKIQVNKNGSKSILTVKSFKTNQSLSKNHFTFTSADYPNYYINNID